MVESGTSRPISGHPNSLRRMDLTWEDRQRAFQAKVLTEGVSEEFAIGVRPYRTFVGAATGTPPPAGSRLERALIVVIAGAAIAAALGLLGGPRTIVAVIAGLTGGVAMFAGLAGPDPRIRHDLDEPLLALADRAASARCRSVSPPSATKSRSGSARRASAMSSAHLDLAGPSACSSTTTSSGPAHRRAATAKATRASARSSRYGSVAPRRTPPYFIRVSVIAAGRFSSSRIAASTSSPMNRVWVPRS